MSDYRRYRAARIDSEKVLRLRLPPELHERVRERAASERRSTNSEIIRLLEQALGAHTQ